jgi:hypothetical protein
MKAGVHLFNHEPVFGLLFDVRVFIAQRDFLGFKV